MTRRPNIEEASRTVCNGFWMLREYEAVLTATSVELTCEQLPIEAPRSPGRGLSSLRPAEPGAGRPLPAVPRPEIQKGGPVRPMQQGVAGCVASSVCS